MFFAHFGLQRPPPGLGTVKKRLRMKNWSWGMSRDFQGPRIEKITTSDFWEARTRIELGEDRSRVSE
eukprot:3740133-Pyramimonas_sp.AAC.1